MPAPPPRPDLAADLLLQLREARSPLARVRVIARAWRAVRGLTPQERLTVAAQLGLDGADDLVEAIAAHQGTAPPAELMKAVNNVQKMDPATLKSIVTQMKDPRQRGQAIGEGLKALESALAGPEAQPAPARAPAAPPAPPAPPKPAPAAPVPAPAPAPVVVAPAPPMAPIVPPAPVPAPRPEPARAAEPPREPPTPPARAVLAEHLAALPVLTARFRHLRRHLDQVRRLSPADLRSVLDVFPDGWARRRALSELIEAGVPARTADALSLIDALQSPADRAWCLGTLADARVLSDEERTALVHAVATPAGRRRLELRLGER